MLDQLPVEIFAKLMEYLEMADVCHVSMTCYLLSRSGSSDVLWRPLIYKDIITDRYTEAFKYFLHTFADKCSWKICYQVLYLLENKQHPYFWEDADDVGSLHRDSKNLHRVSSSGAVKLIVSQYLEDYVDDFVINTKAMTTLSQIIASEPRIPSKVFINTLLSTAQGPYQTGTKRYYRISSSMVAQFARFKQEDVCLAPSQVDEFVGSLSQSSYISQQSLFNASETRVQIAILRVLLTLFHHCEIPQNDRGFIENLVQISFKKSFWTKDSEYLRGWVLYLCKASNGENQTNNIDLFDHSVDPWEAAMQITVKQHVKLSNLKLNQYLHDIINGHEGKRKKHNARKIQRSEDLPQFVVAYFSQMLPVKRKKILCIQRMIIVARHLLRLNNYYSLKEMLASVRGVLTYTSKNKTANSGLSWSNIPYVYLKLFVELESVLDYADNYLLYRERISELTTHTIPILSIHLREIDKNPQNSATHEIKKADVCFVYFNMEIHRMVAIEVGKLYDYFTRK